MLSKLPACDGWVVFGRYGSGEIAMVIRAAAALDYGSEVICKPTVSVVPYGASDPGAYGCWLKTWSENEGLLEQLEAAGVLTRTSAQFLINGVTAQHCELTEAARAELDRQEGRP